MRLPLAIPLDARSGSATIDARLTNTVVENYEGRMTVAPRPGLSQLNEMTGAAEGVVCFNSSLISFVGTTVYSSAGETTFDLNFDGADGSQSITNAGTGGTLSGQGDDSGHFLSNLHAQSGLTSLAIRDNNRELCGTDVPTAFFAGNYTISFGIYIDSTDLANSGLEGIVGIVVSSGSGGAQYSRWELSISEDGGTSDQMSVTYQVVNGAGTFDLVFTGPLVFDAWVPVVIEKSGSSYSVSFSGASISPSGSAGAVPSAAFDESFLFDSYQLADVWNDPLNKVFIDGFVMDIVLIPEALGTITAGQYDTAQSTV